MAETKASGSKSEMVLISEVLLQTDAQPVPVVLALRRARERQVGLELVLDAHLATRAYLLGGDFNVADLNVCSVLGLAALLQYDLSPFANVGAWVGRCMSRPAAQRYQQKAQAAMTQR